jgi:hypothetical protein
MLCRSAGFFKRHPELVSGSSKMPKQVRHDNLRVIPVETGIQSERLLGRLPAPKASLRDRQAGSAAKTCHCEERSDVARPPREPACGRCGQAIPLAFTGSNFSEEALPAPMASLWDRAGRGSLRRVDNPLAFLQGGVQ